MKIQTFKNKKGLIYGPDPKRIGAQCGGVLRLGRTEIRIEAGEDAVMPLLYHGASADYGATFTADGGETYRLGKVKVRGGYVVPPDERALELMELRCAVETLEDACDALAKRVGALEGIFDTDSLNFLIK